MSKLDKIIAENQYAIENIKEIYDQANISNELDSARDLTFDLHRNRESKGVSERRRIAKYLRKAIDEIEKGFSELEMALEDLNFYEFDNLNGKDK